MRAINQKLDSQSFIKRYCKRDVTVKTFQKVTFVKGEKVLTPIEKKIETQTKRLEADFWNAWWHLSPDGSYIGLWSYENNTLIRFFLDSETIEEIVEESDLKIVDSSFFLLKKEDHTAAFCKSEGHVEKKIVRANVRSRNFAANKAAKANQMAVPRIFAGSLKKNLQEKGYLKFGAIHMRQNSNNIILTEEDEDGACQSIKIFKA